VKAGRASIHVECGPGTPWPAPPLAAAVAVPSGKGAGAAAAAFALDAAGKKALAELFSRVSVVTHDAKRLFLAAHSLGIGPPARFFDVMLASYVVAPGLYAHDLAGDARGVLSLPPEVVPPVKDLAGGAPTEATFASEEGRRWLLPRVALPLALASALEPRLGRGSPLRRVLEEIEFPLVPVLARMEIAGVAVDRGVLAGLSKEFDARLADLERRIHEAAGEVFNIGSPVQLGRILFEKLAYPATKKTAKTKSYATGSDVLEELKALSPGEVPGLVLEWTKRIVCGCCPLF